MLNNSFRLYQLLSNKELRDRISSVGSLPSQPEIHSQILKELKTDNTSVKKVADLISKDVGITAKLLQMVNSAFFGLPSHVESVQHAINLLGLDTVQSIVFSAGVFSQFKDPKLPGFSFESIYSQSVSVGAKAQLIAHAFDLDR